MSKIPLAGRPSILRSAPLLLTALLLLTGYDARPPGSGAAPAEDPAGGLVTDTVVVFVVWGTSNGTNVGDGALSPDPPLGTAWEWYWEGTLDPVPLDDPFVALDSDGTSGDGGSAWPQFAITYHGATDRVLFMTSIADGGRGPSYLPGNNGYLRGIATITNALDEAEAFFNQDSTDSDTAAVFGGVLWNAGPGMSYQNDQWSPGGCSGNQVWEYYPWDEYRDDFRSILEAFGDDVYASADPRVNGGRFYFINSLIPKQLTYPDPYGFALDFALDLEADVCGEFAFCSMVQVSEQIKAAHDACIAAGGGDDCDWYQDDACVHWGQDGLDVVGDAAATVAAVHLNGDAPAWDIGVEVPNPKAWCEGPPTCPTPPSVRLDVYKDDGTTLAYSTHVAPSVASPDWTASFGGEAGAEWVEMSWAALDTDFLTVELVVERTGQPDDTLARYVYVPTHLAYGAGQTGFFRPDAGAAPVPVLFEVAVDAAGGVAVQARSGPVAGAPGRVGPFFEDAFGTGDDDLYVLPYNGDYYEVYCLADSLATCSGHPDYFLARLPLEEGRPDAGAWRFTFADEAHVALTPDQGTAGVLAWDEPNLALAFPAGVRLIVQGGALDATGTTLTAAVESAGWGGLLFADGTAGALDGVTVERVVGPAGVAGDAAVEVFDATVTLSGSFIQDGERVHGLWASGDDALVTLDGSFVQNMTANGAGVVAAAGAEVRVYDSFILNNAYVGAGATGMGSLLYLHESQVTEHGAYGVVAEAAGTVRFERHDQPTLDAAVEVSFSAQGGLYAFNGDLLAGVYDDALGTCTAGCRNFIVENWTGSSDFDAKAGDGAVLYAEYDFWGPDRTLQDLELVTGGSGMLDVTPLWDGSAPRVGGGARLGDGGGQPEGGGDSVTSHLDAAYALAARGDAAAAAARLLAALRQAGTDDERTLAYGAAARFSREDVPPGLEALLEAHLGAEARPWALAAMLAAHRAEGRVAEAWATAGALTTEYAGTAHALPGLGMTARLAADAGDLPSAQAALAGLQAGWPELLETAAAAALVRRLEAGDGGRVGGAAVPGAAAQVAASAAAVPTAFRLHGARPNPFTGRTVVPFELPEAARVRVAVYDVLGREVAVLVEGPVAVWRHEAVLDGRGLAAGVYVIQARVEAPGAVGGTRSFSQRVTLVR